MIMYKQTEIYSCPFSDKAPPPPPHNWGHQKRYLVDLAGTNLSGIRLGWEDSGPNGNIHHIEPTKNQYCSAPRGHSSPYRPFLDSEQFKSNSWVIQSPLPGPEGLGGVFHGAFQCFRGIVMVSVVKFRGEGGGGGNQEDLIKFYFIVTCSECTVVWTLPDDSTVCQRAIAMSAFIIIWHGDKQRYCQVWALCVYTALALSDGVPTRTNVLISNGGQSTQTLRDSETGAH